jgi:hypothetical protein
MKQQAQGHQQQLAEARGIADKQLKDLEQSLKYVHSLILCQ